MNKRLLAALLVTAIILTGSGCGQKDSKEHMTVASDTVASKDEDTTEERSSIYEYVDSGFEGFKGVTSHSNIVGENLIVCTNEYTISELLEKATSNDAIMDIKMNADPSISTLRVYSAPIKGGTAKLLYEEEQSHSTVICSYDVNGNIGLWFADDGSYDDSKSHVLVMDKDGNVLKDIDVSFAYRDSMTPTYIYYSEDDDTILAFYDDTIIATDVSGGQKFKLATNGYLLSAGVTRVGLPVAYIYSNDGEVLKTIDIKNGTYKDSVIFENGLGASELQQGEGDYDIFYSSRTAVYGVKLSDGTMDMICDYTSSDIDVTYLGNGLVVDDKNLIISMYDQDSSNQTFELYTKTDPSKIVDKKELQLVCMYATAELRALVIDFNKTHNDCRIKIVEYGEMDNSYERMAADLAAGKSGDIYYLDNGLGDFSIEQCVSKGLLENLTPYIEKDPDISEDDMIPSVFNTTKIDGKTYYLGGHFYVRALIGKKSEFEDKQGWSFEDMKEYVDSKPSDCRIFGTTNKSEMLMIFLTTSMSSFVNWEKGECYFDTPEFKSVLEMCNRGENAETDWGSINYENDFISGKQLLTEGYLDFDEIGYYKNALGGDFTYIGYPDKEGRGVYVTIRDSLGISSACADKEMAWEFVKMIVSKQYQSKHYYEPGYGCPTRKDMFEMYMKVYSTTEKYTDEFGNEIEPREGMVGWDGIEMTLGPISADEEKMFRDQVDSVSRVWTMDTNIYNIVCEEAGAYFSGDKTIDETVSLIQNRAETYVKENK